LKVGRDWIFEEAEVERVAREPRRRGRMPSWLIEFIADRVSAENLGHTLPTTIGDLRTTVYAKCERCGAELAYGHDIKKPSDVPSRYLDSALQPCLSEM